MVLSTNQILILIFFNMKKRKSLTEVDFSPLTKNEALSTKGGGWVMIGGQMTYLLEPIDVYPENYEVNENCPTCDAFGNAARYSGADGNGTAASYELQQVLHYFGLHDNVARTDTVYRNGY